MSTFKQHLEMIPQELYDLIIDYTFTPDLSAYQIDQEYQPQSILQVDRLSRQLVERSLYNERAVFHCTSHHYCIRWLASLDPKSISMLREVRCEFVVDLWQLGSAKYVAKMQQLRIVNQLLRLGITLDVSILYFRTVEADGTVSWTNEL